MLTFIGTVIVGGIIGWIASIIAKTSDQMGCLWNILIGIVGAALGSWIAQRVFHYTVREASWSWERFAIGVGGAVVLIVALRFVGILRRTR